LSLPPDKSANGFGWVLAGIAGIGLIAWISSGSNTNSSATTTTASNDAADLENAEANLSTPTPAPPMPLDVSAAQRGYAQFRKLSSLGGDGSAQIYSRNCYDLLRKTFDWHQLDRCGGFDALASRWADEGDSVDGDALTYFQSEAAATRYLQVASANGLPATEADQRWAKLQSMAQKTRLSSAPKMVLEPMDNIAEDDTTLNALSEAAQNSTDD
jgi:hypothetical protein